MLSTLRAEIFANWRSKKCGFHGRNFRESYQKCSFCGSYFRSSRNKEELLYTSKSFYDRIWIYFRKRAELRSFAEEIFTNLISDIRGRNFRKFGASFFLQKYLLLKYLLTQISSLKVCLFWGFLSFVCL